MDTRRPRKGPEGRDASGRRAAATRHSPYGRRPGAGIAVTAVVIVVIVAFLGVRLGVGRPFGSPQAGMSAEQSAAPVPVSANATSAPASARPSAGSSSSSAKSGSSAGSSASTAWRDADPSWMDKYRGKLIDGFKTEPGYKAVALTFDDGPNGETKHVIDTVSSVGGQATFFDTGRKLAKSWAKEQPAIIWEAGFELGNHTQHHTLPDGISSMWHRSYATDLAEINGPDSFAKAGTGRNTVWLRPMGGMIDATGIKAAVATHHLVINWTIDSNDSHGGPRTPDYIYTQVTTRIKSGDVVLMHVTHPESMAALPHIVQTLSERGFKLVTLSELAQHSTAAITQKIPK